MELYGCHPDANPGRWEDPPEDADAGAGASNAQMRQYAHEKLVKLDAKIVSLLRERQMLLQLMGEDERTFEQVVRKILDDKKRKVDQIEGGSEDRCARDTFETS